MMKLILAALLVSTTLARAESIAPSRNELRTQAVQRNAKSDRSPSRASLKAPPVEVAAAARGLEIDDVLAKVNGIYMTGLQRCYRKSLAVDPSVSGKLDLAFKVSADGRVTSALRGDGIEQCLSTLMGSWRFGVALDDGGLPTEASFNITLVLR